MIYKIMINIYMQNMLVSEQKIEPALSNLREK